MKTIYIDFDGTICPNKNGQEYAPPTQACLNTIKKLKEAGYKIVIYSVRSNALETIKPGGHVAMIEYLSEHKIPYDAFNSEKTHFSILIDDKCLGCPKDSHRNVDWEKVENLLREEQKIC